MPIDIIQVPLNIFDQRLLNLGWIKKLKKKKKNTFLVARGRLDFKGNQRGRGKAS